METPAPPLPEAMRTLDECIAIALQHNPELSAAAWDAEAARKETRIRGAQRWPNVHVTGSYFHHQDAQRLVQPSETGETSYLAKDVASAEVVLRMPLYAGGRIVNEIRAADLLARAEEHSLARSRDELIFNVSSTYFGILAQQRVVESLEFSRDTLGQLLERVEQLIAAQKAATVPPTWAQLSSRQGSHFSRCSCRF
jgi:outer membrane protein TolC